MQVETYELAEVAEQTREQSEECAALAESLGLEGQRAYFAAGSDAPAIPYRKVTAEEAFAYGILCPSTTLLADYKDGPIPLRVLQVAAHAKGMFRHLQVWHPASAREKDPVLVGSDYEHGWCRAVSKTFILARWGEELESFPVLLERAVAAAEKKLRAAWQAIASQAAARLAGGIVVDPSRGELDVPALHGVR